MTQVGFVGIGRMGANMVRRLHDKGYGITAVHDRQRDIAEALAQEVRCEAALLPARVAELSEIIVTVVSDEIGRAHV